MNFSFRCRTCLNDSKTERENWAFLFPTPEPNKIAGIAAC